MPTISVIIPAYNAERTLLETIQSVQQQSFEDFELIVINDGSTDGTQALLQQLNDPRLRIFSYENGGLPTARNRGIAQATGEFVAFLDADDLWTTDKLELQLAALQQAPEAGVAYSWTAFMEVDAQGQARFYPSAPYGFSGNVYRHLLVSDFIHSGSNTLIRRQTLTATGGFEPSLKSCEDWDYWLRIAQHWPFVVVPKYQILYRRTPGAMSSKLEVMEQAARLAIDRAYEAAPAELQFLRQQTMASLHSYCAELCIQQGKTRQDLAKGWGHLWALIQLQPQAVLNARTQKTLIKWLVKFLLPASLSKSLLSKLRQPITMADPRYPL